MHLYKGGTRPGVLIKQGILISEVSLNRDFTVLLQTCFNYIVETQHGLVFSVCMESKVKTGLNF